MLLDKKMLRIFLQLFVMLILQACGQSQSGSIYNQTELEAWFPYGSELERRTIQKQVTRFNSLQDSVRINAVILPDGKYHEQVTSAADINNLPDILGLDPAYIGYHASKNHLQPLDKILTDNVRDDLLSPLIENNIYQGRLYAVNLNSQMTFMFARRSAIERVGESELSLKNWSLQQFYDLIPRLAKHSNTPTILEMQLHREPTWLFDALIPMLDVKNNDDNLTQFVLDLHSQSTIELLKFFQDAIRNGIINQQDDDAFIAGRAALAWGNQANIIPYLQSWPDDVLILSLPGYVATSPPLHGGWTIGISKNCSERQLAVRFIEFLLQPAEELVMMSSSATLPSTHSALHKLQNHPLGQLLTGDIENARSHSSLYSASVAFPEIRHHFDQLVHSIAAGADIAHTVEMTINEMTIILSGYNQDDG